MHAESEPLAIWGFRDPQERHGEGGVVVNEAGPGNHETAPTESQAREDIMQHNPFYVEIWWGFFPLDLFLFLWI